MRARSTAASVWPARTSTPPVARAQREHVAGPRQVARAGSPGRWPPGPVAARSAAEMPVVVAAARLDRRRRTPSRTRACSAARHHARGSRARRAARPSSTGRSGRGRGVAMKLMASGVTFSAAIVRSPSFSRSSSSTTMIIRPARMASMASSMVANGMSCAIVLRGFWRPARRTVSQQALARTCRARRTSRFTGRRPRPPAGSCARVCTGSIATANRPGRRPRDREADAVDRDRPLRDEIALELGRGSTSSQRRRRPDCSSRDAADAVHVALDEVAAEAAVGAQRPLEVDESPGPSRCRRPCAAASPRSASHVKRRSRDVDRRQAAAVHGDRPPAARLAARSAARCGPAARRRGATPLRSVPVAFDDAREHPSTSSARRSPTHRSDSPRGRTTRRRRHAPRARRDRRAIRRRVGPPKPAASRVRRAAAARGRARAWSTSRSARKAPSTVAPALDQQAADARPSAAGRPAAAPARSASASPATATLAPPRARRPARPRSRARSDHDTGERPRCRASRPRPAAAAASRRRRGRTARLEPGRAAVSSGSSASTVPMPTSTASWSAPQPPAPRAAAPGRDPLASRRAPWRSGRRA